MNNQNQNSQQSFNMTAPTGDSKKLEVALIPQGQHPVILYSMLNLGNVWQQSQQYGDKYIRKVMLGFEFPFQKRKFYEDRPEEPSVLSRDFTYIISDKSNLKKFIETAIGRNLQPSEYKYGWNIGQLLNKPFMATVQHNTSKTDPNKVYAAITSISPLTDQIKSQWNMDWNNFNRHNDIIAFDVDPQGNCFATEKFGDIYDWIKKKYYYNSEEYKTFIASGRKPYEKPQQNQGSNNMVQNQRQVQNVPQQSYGKPVQNNSGQAQNLGSGQQFVNQPTDFNQGPPEGFVPTDIPNPNDFSNGQEDENNFI